MVARIRAINCEVGKIKRDTVEYVPLGWGPRVSHLCHTQRTS